jgi:hypothetical protein
MFFVLSFIVHYLLHVSALIGGRSMPLYSWLNGSVDIHSSHPNIYFVYILPEDGHLSGPKHVVSSAQ